MDVTEIEAKLAQGDLSQLLFHGTPEEFSLPPEPGGYDGVMWTASSPVVAQCYIPRSGITAYASAASLYELEHRVPPAPHSIWYKVVRAMGHEALEVELFDNGQLRSWRLPDDYPTQREAQAWIELQGYAPTRNGAYEISTRFFDGVETIMPADWSLPGRLLVTSSEGLRFFNYATGEGDLGDLDYHKLELFREVERQGYDGIVIDDFLQDRAAGNVGHKSFGLFASAAASRAWVEMPAVNREWDGRASTTPDLELYREQLTLASIELGL